MSENRRSPIPAAGAAVVQAPVRTVRSVARHLPGTGLVRGAFDGVLGTVGLVPPRARRVTAYAGAGVLAAAGVVEWPIAAAGAAAVWLTQPRPGPQPPAADRPETTGARHEAEHEDQEDSGHPEGGDADHTSPRVRSARRIKAARKARHSGRHPQPDHPQPDHPQPDRTDRAESLVS
jgi:hypothetical protein